MHHILYGYLQKSWHVHASLLLFLYPESIWALFIYSATVRAGKYWWELLDIGLDHITKSSLISQSRTGRQCLVVRIHFRRLSHQVVPSCSFSFMIQEVSQDAQRINRALDLAGIYGKQVDGYVIIIASLQRCDFKRWSSVLPTNKSRFQGNFYKHCGSRKWDCFSFTSPIFLQIWVIGNDLGWSEVIIWCVCSKQWRRWHTAPFSSCNSFKLQWKNMQGTYFFQSHFECLHRLACTGWATDFGWDGRCLHQPCKAATEYSDFPQDTVRSHVSLDTETDHSMCWPVGPALMPSHWTLDSGIMRLQRPDWSCGCPPHSIKFWPLANLSPCPHLFQIHCLQSVQIHHLCPVLWCSLL